MNARDATVSDHLIDIATRIRKSAWPRSQPVDELPLRSELLSADQMEQHGRILAASHQLTKKRGSDQLLTRLADNEATLLSVCNLLTEAVTANHRLTPAGEWLLDNLYLIQEQIRTARRHLPKGYSRELPRLARGSSVGLPRVYDIALHTISHGDGRVDTESLSRFVAAYQSVSTLQLGELWAIPIMLRLALIENLRRVGARIAAGRVDRNLADTWVDEMTEIAERDPKSLILVVADMARSNPPMSTPFVSELARRLQGQSPALALPLTWIEQRLAESNRTIEQLVQSGNQQQAADQVSISNSIGSLRMLGAIDWREFAESNSIVERTLRQDPRGLYAAMDFATRDRYRHVVEALAKDSPVSEVAVADAAIKLARESAAISSGDPAAHVGFYLIDEGRPKLEGATQASLTPLQNIWRAGRERPLLYYLSAIALITAGLAGALVFKAYADGAREWLLAAVGILTVIASSQVAVKLADHGCGPDDADQRSRYRGSDGGARGPLSGQSGSQSAFRPLDGLPGRGQGSAAAGRGAAGPHAKKHRGPQREVRQCVERQRRRRSERNRRQRPRGAVLPVPSPSTMEFARAGLDGLRAQARQARRLECAPSRQGQRFLARRR
jgi:hypothetical protein